MRGRRTTWGLRGGAVAVLTVFAVADPVHFGVPFGAVGDLVATAGPSADEREAHRVARRYVRALRSGDGELACSVAGVTLRGGGPGPCDGPSFEPLAGPVPKVADPRIDGDLATVRVARGEAPALRLVLRREDGGWRVAAVSGR